MGRTKTTPAADDDVTEISIAVYSCSNYREIYPDTYVFYDLPDIQYQLTDNCVRKLAFGFFNAYGNPVRKVRTPTDCEDPQAINLSC